MRTTIRSVVKEMQRRFPLEHYGGGRDILSRGKFAQRNHEAHFVPPANHRGYTCIRSSIEIERALQRRGIPAERIQVKIPRQHKESTLVIPPALHEFVVAGDTMIGITPWDQIIGVYPFTRIAPAHPILDAALRSTPEKAEEELTNYLEVGMVTASTIRGPLHYQLGFAAHCYMTAASARFTVVAYEQNNNPFGIISSQPFAVSIHLNHFRKIPALRGSFRSYFNRAAAAELFLEDKITPRNQKEEETIWELLETGWPSIRTFLSRLRQAEKRHLASLPAEEQRMARLASGA